MPFNVGFAVIYLVAIITVHLSDRAGMQYWLSIYLFMSMFTLVLYAVDKHAAIKGKWRLSENTLHLSSLLCGWPGALIAQSLFNHKTQKQPFKTILWLTVLLNTVVYLLPFSGQGRLLVKSITDFLVSLY